MLKNKILIIFTMIFLTSCEYKPIYSEANKTRFEILITKISGDKSVNKFLVENIKRNSQKESSETINIEINTQYTKIIVAKDTAGNVTDYQAQAITSFLINKNQTSKTFTVKEKFNFQKLSDKYEEKGYEKNIKKNLAASIAQKLIFRLSIVE